ncbi:hypothetical protein LTR16_011790, partial [Cryomyces antarcticus]
PPAFRLGLHALPSQPRRLGTALRIGRRAVQERHGRAPVGGDDVGRRKRILHRAGDDPRRPALDPPGAVAAGDVAGRQRAAGPERGGQHAPVAVVGDGAQRAVEGDAEVGEARERRGFVAHGAEGERGGEGGR